MWKEELTGRRRYRIQSNVFSPNQIVLQVEVTGEVDDSGGGRVDTRSLTVWRDATPEDFITHELVTIH